MTVTDCEAQTEALIEVVIEPISKTFAELAKMYIHIFLI